MDDAPRRRFSYTPVADAINAALSRDTGPVDRELALTVPAVLRGRNLICSIATLPLVQYASDGSVVLSPLLGQIDPDVANVVTVAQTVEDLLFDGIAWWRVKAYGFDNLRPVQARRVDPCTVSLTPPVGYPSQSPLPSGVDPRDAVVYVDGKPVPAKEMLRFDSPNPALRVAAARSIRKALLIDKLASTFADNPRPLDYFEPSEWATEDPEDDDIREFLSQWKMYRKGNSTGYIPRDYKYQSVSQPSPVELQLVQLQQQAGLEISNMFGLDPYDLGVNVASRDYANVIDRRQDRINDVLAPYILAITQRLSMNDITVRGNRVDMDLDNYLKSNPTERWNVYTSAKALGVITDPEEIRLKEGWGPMPETKQATPEPETPPTPVEESTEEPAGADTTAAAPGVTAVAGDRWSFGRDPGRVDLARGPENGSYDFEFDGCEFTFDTGTRMVEGLALPYGKQAYKYGYKFRFDKGSLEYGAVSRVKITKDHWDAVGVATYVADKRDGYTARGRIARGATGDELLALAEDGVYDGMSVGVDFDFDADTVPDPKYKDDPTARLVKRATLREIAVTAMPAFDDARLTSVKASTTDPEGGTPTMRCDKCGQVHAANVACPTNTTVQATATPEPTPPPAAPVEPAPPTPALQTVSTQTVFSLAQIRELVELGFSLDQVEQFSAAGVTLEMAKAFRSLAPAAPVVAAAPPVAAPEPPAAVDPTARPLPSGLQVTRAELPYRFDSGGRIVNTSLAELASGAVHSFARDVFAMRSSGDEYGQYTEAGKRVMGMFARYHAAITRDFKGGLETFAIPTTATDIAALIPTSVERYVETPAFYIPLFTMINKGALPNGLQPFLPPTMAGTTTIAVATHSEGTEPTATEFITEGTAITPSPMSAKVNITRVALDRVANIDALVWDELTKQYYKTVEDRVAAHLATLTAADNIALDGLSHIALADKWAESYVHLLQGRKYNFTGLALEAALFKAFTRARASSGAGDLVYPPASFSPTNVNGTVAERYVSIDLNGVKGIMAGALGTANSYLFDPAYVNGHATAPTRLDFAGSGASNIYTPVDTVDVAVWGYTALYTTQIAAVKEVTFNNAS